ncbi:hypothetical protein GUITHDRAFT_145529 [Guillardia theta CCMP2712]|uniref:PPM-type phosphatase domain-containing protein n=1 Tax=Guillardia theta (strain CCMP2712) TaxID=905079 RepID=L1IKM7_GUITC|nr:hypothetical protein GUITHDRAFT_145529 [Guillardia theta CCMP2712]EKX36793.1 hypothetical protein GUITHDRAFT_145529 [Guillardia theta CCMP2712]|eukprot:XP_005823773.1 hypothetical protein GUITHDRAFT_145529 [Guillardia theta CCMP2712]
MLTARPNRSKDESGGQHWTPYNCSGWPYGYYSTQGRRPHMEDHFQVSVLNTALHQGINFFGVFDGHSGTRCAEFLKKNLVGYLTNSIRKVNLPLELNLFDSCCSNVDFNQVNEFSKAISNSYLECDRNFLEIAVNNRWFDGSTATTPLNQTGARQSFTINLFMLRTLETREQYLPVLAIPLSDDHKPSRPDEQERIIAAGGSIIKIGVPRVDGLLATSRSFGDGSLKTSNKAVIADPEYMIMASDGVWDVVSNKQAVEIAIKHEDPQKAVEKKPLKGGVREEDDEADVFECKRLVGEKPCYAGWLWKRKTKKNGFLDNFTTEWQKRWSDSVAYAGAKVVHFILAYYTDDSEASRASIAPRKPLSLDPTYTARREAANDSNGRYCVSVQDAKSGKVYLLSAMSESEINGWLDALNKLFKDAPHPMNMRY